MDVVKLTPSKVPELCLESEHISPDVFAGKSSRRSGIFMSTWETRPTNSLISSPLKEREERLLPIRRLSSPVMPDG